MNNRILIADDDEDVSRLVSRNLKSAGFRVEEVTDGAAVIVHTRNEIPALIVLDVMLPGLTGFEVCKLLKSDPRTGAIPIIMLTAKAQEGERVQGLELGADDYMTKPFSPRELVLRVQSQLRRTQSQDATGKILRAGDLVLDRTRCSVRVKGKPIELTATEFKLLELLMERQGRVQSREKLLHEVWGYEGAIESRTVDIHVLRLRAKLGRAAGWIEAGHPQSVPKSFLKIFLHKHFSCIGQKMSCLSCCDGRVCRALSGSAENMEALANYVVQRHLNTSSFPKTCCGSNTAARRKSARTIPDISTTTCR